MAAISKEEYLKRYLSNADSGEKKKRRKKIKSGIKTGKSLIIDDDVNISDIKVKGDSGDHESLLELADENPLIFNETGTTVLSKDLESIKKKEDEKKAMWAPLERDSSPLRDRVKRRHDSISPERGKMNKEVQNKHKRQNSADISPRRKNIKPRQFSPPDLPSRQTRHDSSSDQSPTRHQQHSRNATSKHARHDSPDMSPPHKVKSQRSQTPIDQSPRRSRHYSSSDQSPPRNKQQSKHLPKMTRHDSPDMSPRRRAFSSKRHDSPELFPPHRKTNDRAAPSERSPQRNRQQSGNLPRRSRQDLSPPRKTRHDSPDLSPPRKTKNARVSSPDQSPPRKNQSGKRSLQEECNDGNSSDQSPPRKQKHQERKSGLHTARELREENERSRRQEDEIFARMSSSTTGKGMETIHRDKSGRKRDFKVEEAKKREEERKKQAENEKFVEWGKGVQQGKKATEKVQDDLYEMSKPLARYKNDEDLDQMLKEKDRAGDPMLAFMEKKKAKQNVTAGKKEKPKYKGPPPPPNRFNIPPGYRWDGVDRSNGFEKKRFSMLANKGATKEEAYKWSIEDM